ncbi:hypothetical protein JdFRA1000001_14c [uncultured archaeal virus]|uniref:Uncharacterized protein n=1 Tax=uncultured archaeal virus TaxID=1960247 RepID=A0A1S5Y2V3_9VIRU|nr:hypothetical protein JdFRA1000001_14c [uncultured archaeal virus]
MSVYQGRGSCLAKREGKYIRRVSSPGIDTVAEAVALAYAVLRDYRRGYTYDPKNNCRKIKMTNELFKKRLRYIYVLAKKHGASKKELETIKRLIRYVAKKRKLPKTINGKSTKAMIRKMIAKR